MVVCFAFFNIHTRKIIMSKNPIETAVLSNVKVDYAMGSLALADPFTRQPLRVGVVDMPFVARLTDLLWSAQTQPDKEPKTFFYDFGLSWGKEFYNNLSERIRKAAVESITKPQDYLKDEFTEYLNSYLSYAGVGQFRITEGNRFYVIELKNSVEYAIDKPYQDHWRYVISGFFAALFSSVAEKELFCIGLTESPDRNRFALSTSSVHGEIEEHLRKGKTEKEILAAYGNQHLD